LCSSLTISGHLPAPIVNGGGDRDLEKCNFRNFRGPVTLTLDRVIWHTMYQSSTSIYIPNFIEIGKKNFFVNGLTTVIVKVQGHMTQKSRTNEELRAIN